MPRARRCSLRGCARQGLGTPPLCQEHTALLRNPLPPDPMDDPLGAVVDRIMQHPRAQDLLNNVSSRVDWFAQFLDRAANGGEMPRVHGVRERQGPHRPQTPPPREPQKPAFDARSVMGFKPRDRLTVEVIKTRYRVLAKQHHPDKGGDVQVMARINAAKDSLLKELDT